MSTSKLRNTKTGLIISFVLLIAFLFQVANKAVYTHTHVLANGIVITHAHPYNKTDSPGPVSNHTHTKNEYVQLAFISLLFACFQVCVYFFVASYKVSLIRIKQSFIGCSANDILNNKSPPVLTYSIQL